MSIWRVLLSIMIAYLLVLFSALRWHLSFGPPISRETISLFVVFAMSAALVGLFSLAGVLGALHFATGAAVVIVGSAFTLKFVVLAALSDPAGGRMARVMQALFEGATFGMVSQEAIHPLTSYLAFATFVLFLTGIALLPEQRSRRLVSGLPGTDIATSG